MPLHMRLPKLRGFTNPFRTEYQTVNVDRLAALFPQGGDVTIDDLVAKGAVRGKPARQGARQRLDRRCGQRDRRPLIASAKEKIEAAGGSFTVA